MSEPTAPATRVLEGVYLTLGVAWLGLLVWNHLEPDGPAEWWHGVQERAQAWRGYREAMRRTLEDIETLPEVHAEPSS